MQKIIAANWKMFKIRPQAGETAAELALALYRASGFSETGRRRRYYADTGEDALVLECPLAEPAARAPA